MVAMPVPVPTITVLVVGRMASFIVCSYRKNGARVRVHLPATLSHHPTNVGITHYG